MNETPLTTDSEPRLAIEGIPIGVDDFTDVMVTDVTIRDGALYEGRVHAGPWSDARIIRYERDLRRFRRFGWLKRVRLVRRFAPTNPGAPYRVQVVNVQCIGVSGRYQSPALYSPVQPGESDA